jgi:hypothetical protein
LMRRKNYIYLYLLYKSNFAALAHVLNRCNQPAAGDARWPISTMDFRSNEADRIARTDAGDAHSLSSL